MTLRYTVPVTDGDDRELVAVRLWLLGALGVQELPGALVGWFEHRLEDVPPGGSWEVEPQRDWLAAWKQDLTPVRAGRVTVVPSWLVGEHRPEEDEAVVVLDPGVAFGSGHHATTTLCLEALQAVLRPGDRVLDVGCGTGVLAIAAVLLGAGSVEAVDVDPDAVAATRANAAANDVAVEVTVGSVGEAASRADVVVANLLTPTLHTLTDRLLGALAPGGRLVVSGVASERADGVARALEAAGATCTARADRDGWAALTLGVPS